MQGIETLHEKETSWTGEVTFRWQGTTISMAKILGYDGNWYLAVRPEGAANAELITVNGSARWIMSKEEGPKPAAGASTTSSGSAPGVTEPNITGNRD